MDSKIINNYVLNNNKESKEKIYSIGTSRGILWKYAILKIKEKPLVGGGIECLGMFYADNKIDQDRPHNIILQIASFVGIPAAFVYIIIIFKIFLPVKPHCRLGGTSQFYIRQPSYQRPE